MTTEFRQLIASLMGDEAAEDSKSHVDLVFEDDLPCRISLMAERHAVLVDLFVFDAAHFDDLQLDALGEFALTTNHMALRGAPFSVGLDRRFTVTVSACYPLAALQRESLALHIDYLTRQAQRVRRYLNLLDSAGTQPAPVATRGNR